MSQHERSRRSAMHQSSTLYVGFDVPKESIAVASIAQAPHAAVIALGNIGTRQCAIAKRVRRLQSTSPHLVLVYAAGPGGSWLYRYLPKKGQVCWVVALSFIPQKPGDRVKTNRRDALQLARLARAGDRTPVSVPAVEAGAMRDLCRAREEVIHALKTATF